VIGRISKSSTKLDLSSVRNSTPGALEKKLVKLEQQPQKVPKLAAAIEGIQQELNLIKLNMGELKEVNTKCKSMETSIGSLATKLDEILIKLGSNESKTPTPMGTFGGRGRAI
jgi:hypothetical protein